ncbi:MAG: UvrD-helicase domain-containing protein [Bacteroidales bacterium]|nr:UvrD-helicase domain-containing protein [Bacteroidales bacterium]
MIKILKASAGTGKTYNLALEYIRQLLCSQRPDAYRHILAVTFTNKATDEMKRRILKELSVLASDTSESHYTKHLVPSVFKDAESLKKRSRECLSAILYDYSGFAVSTIDKFFQQSLRAFSHEVGQFASYQVQLDREELVRESVDRVLDGIEEGKSDSLVDWLTSGVKGQLEKGNGFSLDKGLLELGKSLQSLPGQGADFSRPRLEKLGEICRGIRSDFEGRVRALSSAVKKAFDEASIDPSESSRGFMKGYVCYADAPEGSVFSKPSSVASALDPSNWFKKENAWMREKLEASVAGPLQAICEAFGTPYRAYRTAVLIQDQLYELGLVSDLREAMVNIQKEKNVLSLDDSNSILHGIIDGTDAPFIYEKLGVRFENFLLDEFQDTAQIQWENISPLLHNSEASGFDSLVVGDVKQSIYRWRGSDWNLLGSSLEKEFGAAAKSVSLKQNWRSCKEIVDFNNGFFPFAAGRLDRMLDAGIGPIYEGVSDQEVHFREKAPGFVEVSFLDSDEAQLDAIVEKILERRERGALWSDVAVLVRTNKNGARVPARLVEEKIPVVSDDSLFIKSSVTVRRLCSQLSLLDKPSSGDRKTVAGYMGETMDISVPERYHSLTDLCEEILRSIRDAYPESFAAEIPYIQSFMDYLQNWVSINGNHLAAFLKHWDDEDQAKIASPSLSDAVRVITVHKAKGLEFPYVIFPFADGVSIYGQSSSRWCGTSQEGTPLDGSGPYYIDLSSSTADSQFSEDYLREYRLSAVDSLNVFYVALTRPVYELSVLSARPSKTFLSARSSSFNDWKNISQLLFDYVGGEDFRSGEPFDYTTIDRKDGDADVIPLHYGSYPSDTGQRLRFSSEAADYFGPDGSFGPSASRRIRGSVLHEILSRVVREKDLPEAVEASVRSGELPSGEKEETLAFLREQLREAAPYGWFPESEEWEVRNECPLFAADGSEWRPDRVLVNRAGDKAIIIDYKFGEQENAHLRQVGRYMRLYRELGYSTVEGWLWYIPGKFVKV